MVYKTLPRIWKQLVTGPKVLCTWKEDVHWSGGEDKLRSGGGSEGEGRRRLPAGLNFRGFDKRRPQPACPRLLLSLGLETSVFHLGWGTALPRRGDTSGRWGGAGLGTPLCQVGALAPSRGRPDGTHAPKSALKAAERGEAGPGSEAGSGFSLPSLPHALPGPGGLLGRAASSAPIVPRLGMNRPR